MKAIGRVILPAQNLKPSAEPCLQLAEQALHAQTSNARAYKLGQFKIEVETGVVIDGIEILPPGWCDRPPSAQRYIVKFNGNGDMYEQLLPELSRYARELNMAVVGFNFRGVGHSHPPPHCYSDLVRDGIGVVQRLLEFGVWPNNITLDGYSLGGAVATYVAAYFHRQGKGVKLFNDRSFGSMAVVAASRLAAPGGKRSFGGRLFGPMAKSVVGSSCWQMIPAEEYLTIDPNYKALAYSPQDASIAYASSLHCALAGRGGGEEAAFEHTGARDAHDLARDQLMLQEGDTTLTALAYFYRFVTKEVALVSSREGVEPK